MSRKKTCPSYMFYEHREFRGARIKTHIARCDSMRGHDGKHKNNDTGLEWE